MYYMSRESGCGAGMADEKDLPNPSPAEDVKMTDADAESFLLAQLAEYWAWAQADTRVAGFMCFYLMNSTGGPGATGGAQGEPLLLAELKKIGRAIVGGNGSVST